MTEGNEIESVSKLKISNDQNNNNRREGEEAASDEEMVDDMASTSQEEILVDELDLATITDRDEEMEEYASRFKQIYENEFKNYLKSEIKKNDQLTATSLPTTPYNKDTYEMDSMNSTNIVFYFDSLELDEQTGAINSIVTHTFDKSQKCHFHPHAYKKYGPYFNTTLFTCLYNVGRKSDSVAQEFFLDLPLNLYYLLEQD